MDAVLYDEQSVDKADIVIADLPVRDWRSGKENRFEI